MPQPDALDDRPRYHHGNLREALIGAGLMLTREGGRDALVLRDATRRVGVSPTAAYRHFGDREALLAAVTARVQEGVADRMRDMVPDVGTGRARLRAVGLGYISFALAEPGWFDVAFGDAQARPDAVGDLPAPLTALVSALDALVADGDLDPASRPGAEWPCWAAVHGFALLALRGPLRFVADGERQAAAERTVATVIDGLVSASRSAL